ncbi:MAG: hypothetical protein Q8M44_00105, partial [bacterium]|nr:hypothetical protein [bacterium]
ILDILLHNILDIAKSVFQESDDIIFTTNSGALVQNATTVNHITKDDIHNFFAKDEAQSTSKSAHLISKTNHISINK